MARTITAMAFGVVVLCSAQHAFAAVSLFHFSGNNQAVQGQTYAPISGSADLQVTIYGSKVGSEPSSTSGAQAYLVNEGLGVLDPAAGADVDPLFNRVLVNGSNGGEYLRLQFNEAVQVTQLKFAFVGPGEHFDLAVDGQNLDVVSLLGTDEIYDLAPSGQFRGTVVLPQSKLPFGTTWDIIAPSRTDAWNLENVDVVPEPATLIVWATLGLGGLAVRRVARRRVLA